MGGGGGFHGGGFWWSSGFHGAGLGGGGLRGGGFSSRFRKPWLPRWRISSEADFTDVRLLRVRLDPDGYYDDYYDGDLILIPTSTI